MFVWGAKDAVFNLGIVFAVTGIAVMAVLLWRRCRHGPQGLGLLALRALAYLCLLVFLGSLQWRPKDASESRRLYVLVDRSKSMQDEDQLLKKVLTHLKTWGREHGVALEAFVLGRTFDPVKDLDKVFAGAFGPTTALSAGIKELGGRLPAGALTLVVSDGVETFEIEPPALPLRVCALAFGGSAVSDVAVEELRFPPVIFARGDAPFKMTLRYPPGLKDTLPVLIKDGADGSLIWKSTVTLSGQGLEDFEFSMPAPRHLGPRRWRLSVAPAQWDTVAANNAIIFQTEIWRDKLRVLYLCGKPTMDYGYLRELLRAAPSRELVSFVILRHMEDTPPFGEPELSLIPFPAHEIFTRSLDEFDLFILQDFSFARFGLPPSYMDHVRSFVRGGGGFILIAGGNTILGREHHEDFLRDLFGLEIPAALNEVSSGESVMEIRQEKFWNRVFDYHADAGNNLATWREVVSPVYAYVAAVPAARLQKKAAAPELIMQIKSHAQSGQPSAAGRISPSGAPGTGVSGAGLVVSEWGSGRAAWIGFSGTWLWKSREGAKGKQPDLYDYFWESLFAWAAHAEPVREEVNLQAQQDALGQIKIVARFKEPQSSTVEAHLIPGPGMIALQPAPGQSLIYEGPWPQEAPMPNDETRLRVRLKSGDVVARAGNASAEQQEFRAGSDEFYLSRLVEKNSGYMLGEASAWADGVPSKYSQILLGELQSAPRAQAGLANMGPWAYLLSAKTCAFVALVALLVEWAWRRWRGISS